MDMTDDVTKVLKLQDADMKRIRTCLGMRRLRHCELDEDEIQTNETLPELNQSKLDQLIETIAQLDSDKSVPFPPKSLYPIDCYSDARAKLLAILNNANTEVCASCSLCVPCSVKPDITMKCVTNLSDLTPLLEPNELKHLPEFKTESGNSTLKDYMLDPRGYTCTNENMTINLCSLCFESVTKGKIPKFSLRNGLYTGIRFSRLHLPELNWFEEIVISRVHFSHCIIKLTDMQPNSGSHFAFKGHIIVKPTNPDPLCAHSVIMTQSDIASKFQIIFVNSQRNVAKLKIQYKKLFEVRANVIHQWLAFLKANHPDYASIAIDDDSIQSVTSVSDA